MANDKDAFISAYIEAALWSSMDDDGNPLDTEYDVSDIAQDTLSAMQADCAAFLDKCGHLIDDSRYIGGYTESEMSGHDFWLTRNGHGAGFWDGDWPEPRATELDNAAKSFGSFELYVGDDGKIYGM